MAERTWEITTFDCTPGVHHVSPPPKVVRCGESVGAGPDTPGQEAPGDLEYQGFPGDVLLLLIQEGQELPLTRHSLGCFGSFPFNTLYLLAPYCHTYKHAVVMG